MALLDALGLKPDAIRIVTFDGAGAMRTALAGGQVDFNIGQAEGAAVIRDFIRPLAVFLDHRVPEYDVPPINQVLAAYNTSVPLISGSVRTFVFPAAFKAKHPDDYAKFVAAIPRHARRSRVSRVVAAKPDGGRLGWARTARPKSSAPTSMA